MTRKLKLKRYCEGKNKLSLSIVILSFLLFSSCGSLLDSSYGESENRNTNYRSSFNDRMPSESGKCYAKCLIPDRYETFEEEFIVYTGDDLGAEGVVLETIIFRPAGTIWDKVKDNNCKSKDPKDCFVYCLKEVPEVSNDYYIVTDTTIISEYKIEVISYEKLTETGGYTEWKEVVCQADVTEHLYRNIQLALISKGYGLEILPDGRMSSRTKEALVRCQKENGLPVGSLDVETLEFLGVDY